MTKAKIYHNPKCSKSRQTLQLLEDNDVDTEIIEYLKTPPTEQEIKDLIVMLNICPHDLARKNEKLFKAHHLKDMPGGKLIKEMVKHPILIERPIVIVNGKAVIARPPEKVLAIL